MDLESTSASRRRLAAVLLAAGLIASLALAATPAQADVGVEKASRSAGVPGDEVDLTIGCGFCYPPCEGPLGDRDGVCMPGREAPPAAFPVSLVPIEKAPRPYRCGPRAFCSPRTLAPPSRPPFVFLGRAAPPGEGGDGRVPRYLLHFTIPDLRPGVYTFVIFCGSCLPGKAGSLIAYPAASAWRLRVRPSRSDYAQPWWARTIGSYGVLAGSGLAP